MVLSVVVADDHALVRDGIVSLVDDADDIEVVGTARDLPDLLDTVEKVKPDVVITDIRMPPTGTDEGIRASASIRASHPATGVVVLSAYAEPAYARELLGDGAVGRAYLLKARVKETEELLTAVRTVADGGSVVDPHVVETLVRARGGRRRSDLDDLTEREGEVLEAMATGLSNATIAARLGVSRKTIETHISAIFSKLGLTEEPHVNRRVVAVLAWLDSQP